MPKADQKENKSGHGCLYSFVTIVLLVLGTGYYFLFMPRYIELDIPVAKHEGAGDFWHLTRKSTLNWSGSPGRIFVYRIEGTASIGDCECGNAEGWLSQEDIITHMEKFIYKTEFTKRKICDYGSTVIPECDYISGVHYSYTRPGDAYGYKGEIQLAIWPYGSDGGFKVVLATKKPSLIQEFLASID